ncbi:hypothetical protein [Brachyspira sp.]|uniref:hypothetical protein n=1 Tax=Brachyspira sp. TaxID=1977261 RepID=UPI003D7E1624
MASLTIFDFYFVFSNVFNEQLKFVITRFCKKPKLAYGRYSKVGQRKVIQN